MENTTKKPVHTQLRDRRSALGLYQAQVGNAAGMPQQHYQRIEAGAPLRTDTLERLCDAMQLEVMLVPTEKADLIRALINADSPAAALQAASELVKSSVAA